MTYEEIYNYLLDVIKRPIPNYETSCEILEKNIVLRQEDYEAIEKIKNERLYYE